MTGRFGPVAIIACALAALAAAMAPACAAPDAFPVATEIRVGGDDAQTRFVVDLTRKVDIRAFTLADPYRVVIDMPQVTFALPPKSGDSGRGLVKAYRYGLVMAGGSRPWKKPGIEQRNTLGVRCTRNSARIGWCPVAGSCTRVR